MTHVFLALFLLAHRRGVGRAGAAILGLLDADEVALVAQQHRFDGVVQAERSLRVKDKERERESENVKIGN